MDMNFKLPILSYNFKTVVKNCRTHSKELYNYLLTSHDKDFKKYLSCKQKQILERKFTSRYDKICALSNIRNLRLPYKEESERNKNRIGLCKSANTQ